MSNALSAKMPAAKPKIAFIEPPERAVFILDRCARSALWDVAMLVASAPDSQAVRVAKSRGITVRQEPDPEVLSDCDRVIVGHVPFHIFLSLRQIMRDKPGKVLLIDEFLPELMAREEDPAAGESAEVASDSLPDLTLDPASSESRSFGNELLRSLGQELRAMTEEPRSSSADDMPRFGDAFRTLDERLLLDETLLGEPLPAPSMADGAPAGAPPVFERELEIEGMASGTPSPEPTSPADPASLDDETEKPANATRWFSGDSTRMIDPDELDVETLDVTPEVTPAEPGRRKNARPAAPERRPRVVESQASRQARSPEPPPVPMPPPVPGAPIQPPPIPMSEVTPLFIPRPPALPQMAPPSPALPPAIPQPAPAPAPAPWPAPSPRLSATAPESEAAASSPAPALSPDELLGKPTGRPTIALKPKVVPPPRPLTFPAPAPTPAPVSTSMPAQAAPVLMPAQAAPVPTPAPEPAPKALPSAPPPASRQMPAPPPLRFDARTFLGAPIDDPHTSIRLDFQDGRIQRLIDEARQLADATAVNLMLLEPDGEHLRVAAASGLGAEVMSLLRPHTGVGPPGQAFRDRKPAFSRSQAFDLGESDGRPRWRVLASVPITVSQQSIGVVTVKFVSASHLRDEEVIARMDRLAHAMPAALIGAVDLSDLPRAQQREALQLLIDRLMSLDEALPGRLSAFAAALRRVIGAEAIRIFMLDSMEGRLVEIASHQGWAISNAAAAPSNFAFLREVMLRGEPLCCGTVGKGAAPGVSGTLKETSTIGFPIQSEHARCLMLLEEVPTPEGAPDSVLELLQDMVALLEEMINIEQGMVVQEFISELSMRMADRKEHIDLLPIAERANALLDLAIELVAAEVAIWIPEAGAPPEASVPTTSEGGRIRAWALAHAAALAAWMKRKGDRAQGVLAERLDPSAPCGPAPWIGVLDPRGRGVLVIFFDAQELAEAPRQVPPHVLWRVLSELCQLMPDPPGFVPRPETDSIPGPPRPEPPAPRRTSRLKPRSL